MKTTEPRPQRTSTVDARPVANRARARLAFARRRGRETAHLLREVAEAADDDLAIVGNRLATAVSRVFATSCVQLVTYDESDRSVCCWGTVAEADAVAWRTAEAPVWICASERVGSPALRARLARLHVDSAWVHPFAAGDQRAVLVLGHVQRRRVGIEDQTLVAEVVECIALWLCRSHAAEQLAVAKRDTVRAAGLAVMLRTATNVHRTLADVLTVVEGHTELVEAHLIARGVQREEPGEMLEAIQRTGSLAAQLAELPTRSAEWLPPPPILAHPIRVAVVEADVDVRRMIVQVLRGAGHQVFTRPPEDVADQLDLLVCDAATASAPWLESNPVPVLRLTEAGAAPAPATLVKPFGVRALMGAVQRAVRS